MQEDLVLKKFSHCDSTVSSDDRFQKVNTQNLIRLISVFSTTYCCEFLFSVMKFVKTNHHATLTNEHLGDLIHTFLTTYSPDFLRLWIKKPKIDKWCVCCRSFHAILAFNYFKSFHAILAFSIGFVLKLKTGVAARLCFSFSANDSSIEQVCPTLF